MLKGKIMTFLLKHRKSKIKVFSSFKEIYECEKDKVMMVSGMLREFLYQF